jgi:hypothetical protein
MDGSSGGDLMAAEGFDALRSTARKKLRRKKVKLGKAADRQESLRAYVGRLGAQGSCNHIGCGRLPGYRASDLQVKGPISLVRQPDALPGLYG